MALAITGASGNSGIVQRVGAGVALDPDAASYIVAVEAADGQALEPALVTAYNEFVLGCKADASPFPGVSNFDAIKASCIMAGARTLAGALVPLKGPAPTNFNFVAGDYSRITGLKGNGTNKYLLSNRNNNQDPSFNRHLALRRTEGSTRNGVLLGSNTSSHLYTGFGVFITRLNSTGDTSPRISLTTHPGDIFYGVSRDSSATVVERVGNSMRTVSLAASLNAAGFNIGVLGSPTGGDLMDARLSYYSIGEAVDLTALDARLTTLMSAISTALV